MNQERKGRKGKERKGKERKGKERKGKLFGTFKDSWYSEQVIFFSYSNFKTQFFFHTTTSQNSGNIKEIAHKKKYSTQITHTTPPTTNHQPPTTNHHRFGCSTTPHHTTPHHTTPHHTTPHHTTPHYTTPHHTHSIFRHTPITSHIPHILFLDIHTPHTTHHTPHNTHHTPHNTHHTPHTTHHTPHTTHHTPHTTAKHLSLNITTFTKHNHTYITQQSHITIHKTNTILVA